MAKTRNSPPVKLLDRFFKQSKLTSEQLDKIILSGRKVDLSESDYNLVPLNLAYAVNVWVKNESGGDAKNVAKNTYESQSLHTILTWRYGQGIYRFDQELKRSLLKTKFSGDIPSDVLGRLKEPCLYIEHKFSGAGRDYVGFFAGVIYYPGERKMDKALNCSFVTSNLDVDNFQIPLVKQNMQLMLDQLVEGVVRGIKSGDPRFESETIGLEQIDYFKQRMIDNELKILQNHVLPLLLYICSEEPDIINREEPTRQPRPPRPKQTKQGEKFFPAAKPRVWHVGTEVAKTLYAPSYNITGQKKTRHLRRAHWHGYWKGKRGEQEFFYKWIPATFVGHKPLTTKEK